MLPLNQILDIMKRLDEIEKKLEEKPSLRGGTTKQSPTDKETPHSHICHSERSEESTIHNETPQSHTSHSEHNDGTPPHTNT